MIKMAETTRNTISDKIDRFKSSTAGFVDPARPCLPASQLSSQSLVARFRFRRH